MGTRVMLNDSTYPRSGSSTSSMVGFPATGLTPRGGTNTIPVSGQRSPRIRFSAIARRYADDDRPATWSYSSRIGVATSSTGSIPSRSSPSPGDASEVDTAPEAATTSGANPAMSEMWPRRSSRHTTPTRIPVVIWSGPSTSTPWSIGVSAPSRRTRAQPKGRSNGCWGRG